MASVPRPPGAGPLPRGSVVAGQPAVSYTHRRDRRGQAVRVTGRPVRMPGGPLGPLLLEGVPVDLARCGPPHQRLVQRREVGRPPPGVQLRDQAVPFAVRVVVQEAALAGAAAAPHAEERAGVVLVAVLFGPVGAPGAGPGEPGAEEEVRVGARHRLQLPHGVLPFGRQGPEPGQILGLVGRLDLREQHPGVVGEGLPGGVHQVEAVGAGAAQFRIHLEEVVQGLAHRGGRVAQGLGAPVRRSGRGQARPGGEQAVLRLRPQPRRGAVRPLAELLPGRGGLGVGAAVPAGREVGEPPALVDRARLPGQVGEEVEGRRIGPGGLRQVGDAGERAVALRSPGPEPLDPHGGVRADRGVPAEVVDGAHRIGGAAPTGFAVQAVVPVGEPVQDEHLRGVHPGQQLRGRVVLPAQHRPQRTRVGGVQRALDGARRGADVDRAGLAALVQRTHPVHRAVPEHRALLGVVRGRQLPEHGRGGVQPVRAVEARPVALCHRGGPRVARGEIGRHGAEVAGQHRGHAEPPQLPGDPPAQLGAFAHQPLGDRAAEAAQVLQQPPALVAGSRDPPTQLFGGVAEALERPVVRVLRPHLHEHLVDAVQGEQVDLPLVLLERAVRAGVPVVRVVERVPVRDLCAPGDR